MLLLALRMPPSDVIWADAALFRFWSAAVRVFFAVFVGLELAQIASRLAGWTASAMFAHISNPVALLTCLLWATGGFWFSGKPVQTPDESSRLLRGRVAPILAGGLVALVVGLGAAIRLFPGSLGGVTMIGAGFLVIGGMLILGVMLLVQGIRG